MVVSFNESQDDQLTLQPPPGERPISDCPPLTEDGTLLSHDFVLKETEKDLTPVCPLEEDPKAEPKYVYEYMRKLDSHELPGWMYFIRLPAAVEALVEERLTREKIPFDVYTAEGAAKKYRMDVDLADYVPRNRYPESYMEQLLSNMRVIVTSAMTFDSLKRLSQMLWEERYPLTFEEKAYYRVAERTGIREARQNYINEVLGVNIAKKLGRCLSYINKPEIAYPWPVDRDLSSCAPKAMWSRSGKPQPLPGKEEELSSYLSDLERHVLPGGKTFVRIPLAVSFDVCDRMNLMHFSYDIYTGDGMWKKYRVEPGDPDFVPKNHYPDYICRTYHDFTVTIVSGQFSYDRLLGFVSSYWYYLHPVYSDAVIRSVRLQSMRPEWEALK